MNNKINVFVLLLLLLSSCALTDSKRIHSSVLFPDFVRLDMNLDQIEIVGEDVVVIEYSTYFGIFNSLKSINGKIPSRSFKQYASFSGDQKFLTSKKMKRALHDVYIKFPEADYIEPIVYSKEIQKMFLGRKVKQKVKVKAYKIKK